MKFEKGEIAIHIGGGDILPNTLVEVTAVGPFASQSFQRKDGKWNAEPSDYLCVDLSDGVDFFCDESKLRKRPSDEPFSEWFRNTIITDPIAVPNLETTMRHVRANLSAYSTGEGSGS